MFVHSFERVAFLREQQRSGGALVQAVDQFDEWGSLTVTEELDHTATDPATAVDSQVRRLVDCQQPFVLEQQFGVERRRYRLPQVTHDGFRGSNGRHAHAVAGLQPVGRIHPTTVHPHLAAAQDTIDVALGNALEQAKKVIVDALVRRRFVNLLPSYGIFAWRSHLCLYCVAVQGLA